MGRKKKQDADQPVETSDNGVAPSKPKSKLSAAEQASAKLTRFESYEIIEIHRNELKNAPYNPRTISAKAKAKLRKKIGQIGLLDPIIWNRKSQNIVGGHQRISAIDALEGHRNYTIRVAAVELDDKAEKEANVFLNNETAQGDWDLEKLEALYKEDKIGIEESGYDMADIFQMFGDNPLIDRPEDLADMAERIREAHDAYQDLIDKVRTNVDDQYNFYMVVVFEKDEDREAFMTSVGVEDNKYIDGRELWSLLYSRGILDHGTTDEDDVKAPLAPDEEEDTSTAAPVLARKRITIPHCPRCGEDHLQQVCWELSKPSAGQENYWTICPRACQPVLIKHEEQPDDPGTDADQPA